MLHVILEKKELVWLPKPKWDKSKGYAFLNPSTKYTINAYHPVRLVFSVDGHLQL